MHEDQSWKESEISMEGIKLKQNSLHITAIENLMDGILPDFVTCPINNTAIPVWMQE